MKTFPILYKKTNTGAIQTWLLKVDGNTLITEFGQLDGKLQTTEDVIKEGKNPGKANATTAEQQALKEGEAKWLKQKKKRYVEDLDQASAGEVDSEVILGGIAPMLAPSKIWPIFANKMRFPVFVQPKLDGTRLIAILKDGRCTLWSRTQKPVYSLPHIIEEIGTRFGPLGDFIFDGEAYNTEYRDSFEDLVSIIRQAEPADNHTEVHYHIYDLPSCEAGFLTRSKKIQELLQEDSQFLKIVPTYVAHNQADIDALHIKNVEAGYEGSMIRNDGLYEQGKHSYNLQKLKNWMEDEYEIVGVEEGRGKDAGTVGAFVCNLGGATFKARLKATYDRRRELFNKPELWQGFSLTVKYQNLSADGVPRFPIGKGLRKGKD
jgi:DNA ligase-1